MAFETLRYEVAASGVATVTLDQPETRNALSDQVLDELIAAFEAARDDEAVRCVVLDLLAREGVLARARTSAASPRSSRSCTSTSGPARFPRLFRLIGELGKPTICAANGHVLAGALGLALACDLIVAREGVRFGTPEINVGAFPFMIMALIYRNVAAQEDQRAAAARRADLRRGGGADRDRQPGRARRTSSTPR